MKTLNTRTEIAKAINVDRLTTVRIDLADSDDYGIVSQKIQIDNGTFRDGTPYTVEARIRAFTDEQRFVFTSGCVGISSSFTYRDFEDMVELANAPLVKPGTDIVLAIVDSKEHQIFKPLVMHVDDRVDPHCSTPIRFTDGYKDDARPFILAAARYIVAKEPEAYKDKALKRIFR